MQQTYDDLPDALYTVEQVRALDARLIASGTPGFQLMGTAAEACWRALRQQWPDVRTLTLLAGRGNNAGDGYLIAALAKRAGWSVRAWAVGEPAQLQGDAAMAYREAVASGVVTQPWRNDATFEGVVIDALLGTGAQGSLRPPYDAAIKAVNSSGCPVLAVDVPSGLNADTGHALEGAIKAVVTVTFIALKQGLFTGEAGAYVGRLVFDDLGANQMDDRRVASPVTRLSRATLPQLAPRVPTAHKGHFGHVLVIGGDRGMGGAALLMAESALRAGAGLVSVATREEHVAAAQARRPELMTHGVRSANQLLAMAEKASVLVVGPGLGGAAWGRSLLSAAAVVGCKHVWDADALNLLATGAVELPEDSVITPHPGEAARLLSSSTGNIQADRFAAAFELARRYRTCVVLKGAGTIVAAPDGRLAVCDRGHPAMAGSGLGDVLAGLIGALRAQGMNAYDAACLGVWLHACAGERIGLAEGRGLAAGDMPTFIRQVIEEHSPCRSVHP
ncbi:NAD(P)H-hydrate dehydratase [Pseudomonas matsuisoli]|uniref:Bifunctional NAD(P)H-hydrate repair enzyme n=1 Tax=Pseudomonas matsuisoli TaxID=1515666 RepID=A0A917PXL4_9PSED|nr:NAD(P)H-hydrate dehydratase [Pseudomonas matsuisoli]GGJ97447.1 bifunctional NAD(P)H-hydrate repair enzyme [Pseudomonas matsuisoli]